MSALPTTNWEDEIRLLPNFRGKKKSSDIVVIHESLWMNRHERRKARKFGMKVDLKRNTPYTREKHAA
jgi:hypothetical protein